MLSRDIRKNTKVAAEIAFSVAKEHNELDVFYVNTYAGMALMKEAFTEALKKSGIPPLTPPASGRGTDAELPPPASGRGTDVELPPSASGRGTNIEDKDTEEEEDDDEDNYSWGDDDDEEDDEDEEEPEDEEPDHGRACFRIFLSMMFRSERGTRHGFGETSRTEAPKSITRS